MGQVALDRAGEFSDSQPIDVVQLVRPADNAAFDLPAPDTEANDPFGFRHTLGQLTLGLHAAPPPFRLPAGDAESSAGGSRASVTRHVGSNAQRGRRGRTAGQGLNNQEASLTTQTLQGEQDCPDLSV